MIKTLQKKIVRMAMAVITFLMVLMLVIVNATCFVLTENQNKVRLTAISRNRGAYENMPQLHDSSHLASAFSAPSDDDILLSSSYFVVCFDQNGKIVSQDMSHTAQMENEELERLASEAYKQGKPYGKIGQYRYEIKEFRNEQLLAVIFLDGAHQLYIAIQVFMVSILIGLLCWILMLYFVRMYAKRVSVPIEQNMEKQKQFITNSEHEIKTILAVILANAEVLELHDGENKWSRNIREQTLRLDSLIKNLLMLARVDEFSYHYVAADFSISSLLEETIFTFQEGMELKRIHAEMEIQPDVHRMAHRDTVSQMISLLLDNAVKYTEGGGTIHICLQEWNKHIVIRIENTCERLPQAPPDKLFERFYRGENCGGGESNGHGIGLAAAKNLAELNHGTIQAEYDSPKRMIFTVRF